MRDDKSYTTDKRRGGNRGVIMQKHNDERNLELDTYQKKSRPEKPQNALLLLPLSPFNSTMLYPLSILSLLLLFLIHLTHGSSSHQKHIHASQHHLTQETDEITFETRAYWMRKANSALTELASPCPFAAFGTVIVNHTATTPESPHGKLICYSVNQNIEEGNPTLHGTSIPFQSPHNYLFQHFHDPRNEDGS